MSSKRKIKLKPDEKDKVQQIHGFYMPNIKPPVVEPIPNGTICEHCKLHKATIKWCHSGMDAIHGSYWYWCKCCELKEYVKEVEEGVAKLQSLKDELAKLKCT